MKYEPELGPDGTRYYSGQWMQPLYKSKLGVKQYIADSLPSRVNSEASFVLFYSDENLESGVDSMKKEIPALELEKTLIWLMMILCTN
ncbi:MAG: hypothetical protein U0Z17_06760 [Bacteroidales bacterium]